MATVDSKALTFSKLIDKTISILAVNKTEVIAIFTDNSCANIAAFEKRCENKR